MGTTGGVASLATLGRWDPVNGNRVGDAARPLTRLESSHCARARCRTPCGQIPVLPRWHREGCPVPDRPELQPRDAPRGYGQWRRPALTE